MFDWWIIIKRKEINYGKEFDYIKLMLDFIISKYNLGYY